MSIAASCACVALTGCANPTSVRWNKADNYAGKPARVLLVTDIGSEYGDEFAAGFSRQFTALAAGCGASLDIVRTSPSDRARAEDQPRAREYAADTVLSIRRSGGTRSGGLVIHVIYDIRLIEMSQRKTVWRASADFHRGGSVIPVAERGADLASDVVTHMVEAAIWKDCGPKRKT